MAISENRAKITRFGTDNITKMLIEFSIPAMFGLMVAGLYNIIDSIFLGNAVGGLGLAATTVAFPVTIVMTALSALVGVGGNSLAAIKFGEGKDEEAEQLLSVALTLLIIEGVIVGVGVSVFIEPILHICGANPESWEMSKTFIRIISLGFVFNAVSTGINNFIRTAGAPRRAFLTMLVGAFVCTVLNYVFVIVMGMGVKGSALATIVGQGVSAATVLQFFLSKRAPFRLRASLMRVDPQLTLAILRMGLPVFTLQLAVALVSVVLNNTLSTYGAKSAVGSDGALAAIGIINRINSIMMYLPFGIAQGAQAIEGYNYGAFNFTRVKETLRRALIAAIILAAAGTILVEVFALPLVGLFGVRGELQTVTVHMMRIWFVLFTFMGAQVVAANYFTATGQPTLSAFLLLIRQFFYLIPLYYFMPRILSALWGVDYLVAIAVAQPTADALSLITTSLFLRIEWKRLTKQEKEKAQRSLK